jgi:hypothetical protein
MGILILFLLVFIAAFRIVYKSLYHYNHTKTEKKVGLGISVVFSFFASVLITLVISVILLSFAPRGEKTGYKSIPIHTLSVHGETKGVFILGSGGTSDKLYYYYYVSKDGGYSLDKSEINEVIIFEDDISPCVRNAVYKRKGFWKFILGNIQLTDKKEIHIPRGSLIKHFNPNY